MKNTSESNTNLKKQLVSGAVYIALAVTVVAVTVSTITSTFSDKENEMPDNSLQHNNLNNGTNETNFDLKLPESGSNDINSDINNFTADTIDETEPGSKLIKLIRPEGLLPSSDDRWISVKSPVGFYDQNKKLLWLDDNVRMVYSDGMTATTETVFYDSAAAKAYSVTPVFSEGYFGTLRSEGFEYYKDRKVIIFTGKSKIVIRQEEFEEEEK